MTEIVTPIEVSTDAWVDLVNRFNTVLSLLANNVVSTGGTTTGNINIVGNLYANTLFSGSQQVVTYTRQVVAGNGLSGGGPLSANVTINLNANTLSAISRAETSLQTSDFTGKVGLKEKITVNDIDATGSANSTSYLAGDGSWKAGTGVQEAPVVGGPFGRQGEDWVTVLSGDSANSSFLAKTIYDPNDVEADVFDRANHTGYNPLESVAQGSSGTFVVGRATNTGNVARITIDTSATANTIPIRDSNNTISVGTATSGNHATNKTYVDNADATRVSIATPEISGSLKETVHTISDGSSVVIDPNNGSIQLWTLGANRTPSANNFQNGQSLTLMINDGSNRTINWSSLSVSWIGGSAPSLATSGYTVIELWRAGNQTYGARTGDFG